MSKVRPTVTGNQEIDRFARDSAQAIASAGSALIVAANSARLAQRGVLNVSGAGVIASDSPGTDTSNLTITTVDGRLTAGVAIGGTSASTTLSLHGNVAGKIWLAIGAYSSSCEVLTVTGVSANVILFSATAKVHASGEAIVVLYDTMVTPQLFGYTTGDATSALQAAINATSRVYLPLGTYPITGVTIADNKTVQIKGSTSSHRGGQPNSRIVAYGAGPITDLIKVGDTTSSVAEEQLIIEDVFIDGQNVTTNGLHFLLSQNCIIRNVTVAFCSVGIFIDGSGTVSPTSNRVMQMLVENCYTTGNTSYGYKVSTPGFAAGAFSGFTLLNCSSESDTNGAYIESYTTGTGNPATIVKLDGCELEGFTGTGIAAVGCTLSLADVYVEGSGTTVALTGYARVYATNCNLGNPTVDSTSTLTAQQSYLNSVGSVRTRMNLGQMSDWSFNSNSWGPPNYPSSPTGVVYQKGFGYTDKQGIEWICTTPGTSNAAAFSPRHGKIIVPVSFTQLTNGSILWFPFENFVMHMVTLACSTNFVRGTATFFNLGTLQNGTIQDDVLRVGIAGVANSYGSSDASLPVNDTSTNRFVLAAAQNVGPNPLLTGGKRYFMPGTAAASPGAIANPGAGNRISVSTDGTWTAGSALLIIEGTNLKFD